MDGKSILAYTMSHELTHFIAQWSPEKYRTLADFLMQSYREEGRGDEMDLTIAKRMESGMSYEVASEEFVAECCQRFLLDSNAMENATKLAAKDRILVKRMVSFLKDYAAKIRAKMKEARDLYKDTPANSLQVARGGYINESAITETLKNIDKLRTMWEDALVDAGRNYRASGQGAVEEKGAVIVASRAQAAADTQVEANTKPATREETKNLIITDPRNVSRIQNEITAVLNGTMPSNKMVMYGNPSPVIVEFLGSNKMLYMPQTSVKKAVLPQSIKGGKHGFGRIVLDELAYQLYDPMAITGNTSEHVKAGDDSIVVWTD